VLLWQRWIRYAAVLVASVGALLLLRSERRLAGVPLLVAAAAYLAFTAVGGLYLRRTDGARLPVWMPGVVVAADLTMVVALIVFSSPPAQYHRILLLGLLVLQLTIFYFGRRPGGWAAACTAAAYVLASLVLPPYVPGARPAIEVVVANTLLYLFAVGVLTLTFGDFRERMNRLRVFVKRVEIGDLAGTYDESGDKRPDDLTLLGRSFNEMRTRLIELIGTDPLTNLQNRRTLETRLRREWRQARRRDSTLAVLMIDVDHFKQINDTHGHATGDVVLQELAEIMRSTARDTDVLARVGGDEFVVVLPDTGRQGAITFAERLRCNVAEHRVQAGDQRLEITISVGVALAKGSDPFSIEQLLGEADRALYKAKSSGRNRIFA
jgi:diguanylate cyclase (GGDEF)-like protein